MATPTLARPAGSPRTPALPEEPIVAIRALERAGARVKVSAAIPLGPCQSRDCSHRADVVLTTVLPGPSHRGFIYALRVCLADAWLYAHADMRRGGTVEMLVPAAPRVRAA